MIQDIQQRNKQYERLMFDRNAQTFNLYTYDDKHTKTFRLQSRDVDYLHDRGKQWMSQKNCTGYVISPYKYEI